MVIRTCALEEMQNDTRENVANWDSRCHDLRNGRADCFARRLPGGEPLQIVENDEPEQHIKIPEEYVGSWLVAASAEFADGKLIAKKAENRGIVSVSEEPLRFIKMITKVKFQAINILSKVEM